MSTPDSGEAEVAPRLAGGFTPDPSELDGLMARLADGERAVFGAVFQRLWGPIFGLSKALLRNEADAADAAQEAMKKILERVSGYDRQRPALPWALAIAGWECRTLAKKRSRRREVLHTEASAGFSASPEETYLEKDLEAAAVTALGALSAADKEALRATYWEESASVSGATLRKRRERALTRLRTAFRRLYGLD
jgi:RNA polymerase sigma-70 factor (ECF subfamily)